MTESDIKLLEDHVEWLIDGSIPDTKSYMIGKALNRLIELYKCLEDDCK